MSLNLALVLREAARQFPERTALAIGDTQLPYKKVHGMAQLFAGGLRGLGVARGEHVALMLPNVPHFTLAYFGSHYVANPVVPLNVLLTPDEIAYHLEDSDAAVFVVWEGFYEQARAAFDRVVGCRHLIVAKADPTDLTAPVGAHNMMALVGRASAVTDLPDTMPDDTAVILYTSGTTGRPKGAELTHFNLFYNAQYVCTRLLPMMEEQQTALATLPLFHSFGQTVMHNAVLMSGGTIVLLPRFDVAAACKLMQAYKVTLFAGVPTMYFALLNDPQVASYDLSSLRFCVSGGAAMPVEVMKTFDERYKVSILEGYGLSETSPVASFNHLDRPKKVGSIGTPIWGVEFELRDDAGAQVNDPGTPGEIWIKGHNVMKGYYKRPEATAKSIQDGWFSTGDIATCDADGFYAIVDRKKDMIIRGGFNVYPRELEEVLYAHGAIAEAAVIGVPDEKLGEEVKAFVALKPGATCTVDELRAYCKEHLAAYKYPRVYEIIDSLPKGPTGKILKRALREPQSAS